MSVAEPEGRGGGGRRSEGDDFPPETGRRGGRRQRGGGGGGGGGCGGGGCLNWHMYMCCLQDLQARSEVWLIGNETSALVDY